MDIATVTFALVMVSLVGITYWSCTHAPSLPEETEPLESEADEPADEPEAPDEEPDEY